VLFEGSYIPHDLLRDNWRLVTGDSYIVDITRIRDARRGAGYAAKYAGKAVPHAIWTDRESFEQVVVTFRSRRLWQPWGTWRRWGLSKMPKPEEGWVTIGPLHAILARAHHYDPEALYVLSHLSTGVPIDEPEPEMPP